MGHSMHEVEPAFGIEEAYIAVAHSVIDTFSDEIHDRTAEELLYDAAHADVNGELADRTIDPRIGIMMQWRDWFQCAIDNLEGTGICPHGNHTDVDPASDSTPGMLPEPCADCAKILALFR